MQTRNRFLETNTRLVSRRIRFSDAKFLAGRNSPETLPPAVVDADTFALDILQFFFDERLTPPQLNDHLRRIAAYALNEANKASENLDFVPRPPALPPTLTWLVSQPVQIAYRKTLRDGKIYEIVRIRVKQALRSEYELAKQDIGGALSYRGRPRTLSANDLHLSQEGFLFMQQFPQSTLGNEEISMVETTVKNATNNITLNQHQFDALISFCSSITTMKFLSSTLLKVMNTPTNEQFTEDQRNAKIAEEIRKWKLIGGDDDADSISRRSAEADLFLGGSYSAASSVFRSYAAFARAKSLPRVSRMQNPAVAVGVAGLGYNILKGIIDNKGDISYDLAKMDGQKCPFDDLAKYKDKAQYQESTFTVHQSTSSPGGTFPMAADFEVKYQYNGYAVGSISMQYLRGKDATGWGLEIKADIMPLPGAFNREDGESMAGVEITFNYRFSTSIPFRDDDVWIGTYRIFGDGRMVPSERWTSAP